MVYSIVLNDLPGSYENFTRRFVMFIKSAPALLRVGTVAPRELSFSPRDPLGPPAGVLRKQSMHGLSPSVIYSIDSIRKKTSCHQPI
jgi:hypothetical protein